MAPHSKENGGLLISVIALLIKSWVGYAKGWSCYSFSMFSKQFLLYHKEGVKCWPGWYFIFLEIYLATIDDSFISIPFIDLEIFSIQWIKSGVEVPTAQVPTEQVAWKTIGISNLHRALHTHILTNAKSVGTLK